MSDIQFPSDIATVGGIEIQNLVKVCSVLRSYWDNIHVSNKHLLFPHNVGWKTVPGSSSGLCWKVWPYPTQRCQHGTFNECVKDQRSVQLQCLQMEQSQNCSEAHPSGRAKHLLHHNGMDTSLHSRLRNSNTCVLHMCLFLLQFDFKSHTLSDIQQGRRAEKIEFKDVLSYQSEVLYVC